MSVVARRAIFLFILGAIAVGSVDRVLDDRNRIVVFLFGIVVAVSLFVIRQEFRWTYALTEIFFALFVLWDASAKGRGDFSSDFSNFRITIIVIQTFGAIYVLIRGWIT
jgi:hypothetical protein